MRRLCTGLLFAALACGCTALDFFGYRENTGLETIARPKGYDSAEFGTRMAATSNREMDLLAASAGEGYRTVLFQLASGGRLRDPGDPWRAYPDGDEKEHPAPKDSGTGAALAGLPTWGADETGCIAVGEPKAAQVAINCEPALQDEKYLTGGEGFGQRLAAVRPAAGEPWLLAVAEKSDFAVWSGYRDDGPEPERNEFYNPREASGIRVGEITQLAAGRVTVSGETASRFFVAAGIFDERSGRYQVYLFLQSFPGARSIDQWACLEQLGEPGFGGSMATGDLDGDGSDELAVSADVRTGRKDKVYVYDAAGIFDGALAGGAGYCDGDEPEPVGVALPGEGDLDVECGDDGCLFGAALAIGDIATDDTGAELIVGAPAADADGKSEAGAVYLYRGADLAAGAGAAVPVAGQVAHSSPEKGHRFGGGVAVAPMAGRNELIAAATGKGNLYIAFCTGVGEDLKAGADVPYSESGTVVSTRCRP